MAKATRHARITSAARSLLRIETPEGGDLAVMVEVQADGRVAAICARCGRATATIVPSPFLNCALCAKCGQIVSHSLRVRKEALMARRRAELLASLAPGKVVFDGVTRPIGMHRATFAARVAELGKIEQYNRRASAPNGGRA